MERGLSARGANRLKALILVLLAIFFAEKFVSGKLYYYIGPRFGWLSVLAVALFIALANAYGIFDSRDEDGGHDHHRAHDHHHDHDQTGGSGWKLLIVALPLILGVLVPARPLDATAVSTRGVSTQLTSAADVSDTVLFTVASERNVLDWVRAISANPDPAALNGEEADVVGFVYRDVRFGENQFMVARFTLSCCVADATAIGVVVASGEASSLEQNSWVRVQGAFHEGALDGQPMAVLAAEDITPVEPPEQPYLFQ
jgi:uncharacterized repeat protein (TIGR03943 family)